MKHDLSVASRIIVAFASGALVAVFFLPAWRIDLFAPQYPEGLTMNIWISGISGDVDVINGLNHYIGMRPISESMFPEFRYLPYIVGFFMLLGMIVSITGKRKFLFIYLALTGIGGLFALWDFWKWGKDYGSHLNPTAPIQVPGLTYQPPVIGHKRLLNFDAYSFPDVGGWVVIAAGTIAFIVWFSEWYRHRKPGGLFRKKQTVLLLLIPVFLVSCSTRPEPFQTGKDNCYFCKMGVTDTRFGGELITKKGKIYKFDDLICMARFLQSGGEKPGNISKTLTIIFDEPNSFLEVEEAFFIEDPQFKSPMSSHTAGFRDPSYHHQNPSSALLTWNQVMNKSK